MRIFYGECKTKYAFDLLEKISQTDHEVSHIGIHGSQKEIKKLVSQYKLSNIEILDSYALYKRDSLRSAYKNYFDSINPSIIESFSDVERDFYILTDRSNYDSVTFRERKLYFYDLIRFCLGYLKKEKIEVVYFPYAPHTAWELVFMRAAEYLEIPFFYFSHTAINNRSLLRTTMDCIEEVPRNYLEGLSLEEIASDIDPELIKDFEEDSVVTEAVKQKNDTFNKQSINYNNSLISKLQKSNTKIPFKLAFKRFLAKIYYNYFKRYERRFYLPFSMDKKSSYDQWVKVGRQHKKFSKALKERYESMATDVDLTQNYIYFPMHLQPEMTTQPEAGIFEDHYLVLEQIIQALPEGWKIYMKENPRQYDVSINKASAMNFRDMNDLQDFIDSSPHVEFVKQSIKTPDLLKNAKVVVTQTGTVGWECLTSGKPIISMAKPWYGGCESCYKVSNAEDLKSAINKVLKATQENVNADLMRYLHFYQDKLFIGSKADNSNVSYNTRSYEELLSGHVNALVDFLDDNQKIVSIKKKKAK